MRTPSRRMPPAQGPKGRWLVTMAMVGGVALLLLWLARLWWPLALAVLASIVGLWAIGRRSRPRADDTRNGRSICRFARGFDRRTVDTWIIRAVYEESSRGRPVRPSDRLEDLLPDDDDRDIFLLCVAQRTGRSLEGIERTPIGRFVTLRDVVMFFHHQPLISASQQRQ
jgi:hypothetical protein